MVAMAVTVRCAVMVWEGAPLGLSSLFYSSNCSRVIVLPSCALVTAMKSKIMCISPLPPPENHKNRTFFEKTS